MRIRIRKPNQQPLTLARDEIAVKIEPGVRAAPLNADRRRMNPFPGRSLTARALTGEQLHRSWHIAHLNRTLSAGVVQGLGLAFADAVLAPAASATDPPPAALDLGASRPMSLEAGLAVATSGEEIDVPGEAGFDALDLPVAAPQWVFEGVAPPPASGTDELLPRNVGGRLRELLTAGRAIPRVGVIVAEPVEYDSLLDPDAAAAHSQCERDLEAEAFDDEVRQDSARLVYYAWPEEWLGLPAADAQWRNRLAWAIFAREALLADSTHLPWWRLGVPLSLVAFNASWQPLCADRAAVVRIGGAPRTRLPFVGGRGTRFLWQARIEQLTEHVAEARALGVSTAELAAMLRYLPPAGLLPRDAIDARARRSVLFPPTIEVDAAPVPVEQLDALLEDSAGGAPIDFAVSDQVRVLVPVPQALFEPDLLVVEQADADGEFARAIDRFIDVRADWLRRRHSLREKGRQLAVAVEGPNVPEVFPVADDPQRLEPERFAPLLPAPAGVIHRSALVAGMHQHFIDGVPATSALTPGANDVLYGYVLIDREQPPREVMLQFNVGGRWEHRAFWGEDLIGWGVAGTASRLARGSLPQAGEWIRLEVPARELGLAGQAITGIAFTLFDGRAAWGPAGIVTAETPWLTQALINGANRVGSGEGWEFVASQDANAPFEDAWGTTVVEESRVVAEIAALAADPTVSTLRLGPRTSLVSVRQMIESSGLRATIAALKRAVAETNDAIDFGFIRVQSDLYRLRQSVLKQSQATRFAVSPALTQIAELDSAAATREQLSQFYTDIKTPAAEAPSAPPATGAGGGTLRFTPALTDLALDPGLTFRREVPRRTTAVTAGLATLATAALATDLDQKINILDGDALVGLAELRNVSIAARMEQPRAVETKNFTLATRIEVTSRLAASEIDLSDVTVAGVPTGEVDPATGQPRRRTVSLTEISDFARTLTDPSPDAARADEAHYFLGGIDVADFTIGLLRNFEGVVARYRRALERCDAAVARLAVDQAGLARRLTVVDRELAEARQDVATARALLAEEIERVRAINDRRDRVIDGHVPFLAYARPRLGKRLQSLPSRALDNAFAPDAVPACFARHDDPPAELAGMLAVIRRAPVSWFPAARGLLDLIDRLPHIEQLVSVAQRAQLEPASPVTAMAAGSPLIAASVQAVHAQAGVLARVRAEALPALAATATSLASRRLQVAQLASLIDLASFVDNAFVSRRAAQEYERIATIAGCLHARLSDVRPALRLVWAERFSQFDTAPDLGDLSLLPRIGEEPEDVREDIIELAGWLRGRAARDIPRAQALMNDLLRVCLLTASHSPVNEIVTGRVLRPLPLLPGTLVPIKPFLFDKVRLGMQVHFFDANRVAAMAVVDDLHDDTAMVRVLSAAIAGAQATEATTVHFVTRAL
jgi:hypothetical protein